MQLVTLVLPLTVTTASGKPFTITPGEQATATWAGWTPTIKGSTYYLSGTMHNAEGRLLRCWDGFEPRVRVDHLHRAVTHTEPLYRYCDRCHGTGRNLWAHNYGDRRSHDGPNCKACSGSGHARTYPATRGLAAV
jgi:hypothetical protein